MMKVSGKLFLFILEMIISVVESLMGTTDENLLKINCRMEIQLIFFGGQGGFTVIRFASVSAKIDICIVAGLNGAMLKLKYALRTLEHEYFSFKVSHLDPRRCRCQIY
jgi:hypothetical protein